MPDRRPVACCQAFAPTACRLLGACSESLHPLGDKPGAPEARLAPTRRAGGGGMGTAGPMVGSRSHPGPSLRPWPFMVQVSANKLSRDADGARGTSDRAASGGVLNLFKGHFGTMRG